LHILEFGLAFLEPLVDLEKQIAVGNLDQVGDESRVLVEHLVLDLFAKNAPLENPEIAAPRDVITELTLSVLTEGFRWDPKKVEKRQLDESAWNFSNVCKDGRQMDPAKRQP